MENSSPFYSFQRKDQADMGDKEGENDGVQIFQAIARSTRKVILNISRKDDLIMVDVTASYPKKELILQDSMDVEYIPLETSEEFITMGWLHAVGKEVIIVRNRKGLVRIRNAQC